MTAEMINYDNLIHTLIHLCLLTCNTHTSWHDENNLTITLMLLCGLFLLFFIL